MKKDKRINGHIYMTNMGARLKVVKVNYQTYIIDVDQSLFWIIFPFYHWFFPIYAYLVPSKEVEKLETINYEERKNHPFKFLAAGASTLLGYLLKPLGIEYILWLEDSIVFRVIILILIIIIIIIIRYSISVKSTQSVQKIMEWEKVHIKLRPASCVFYFKILIIYFFWMSLTFLFVSAFIMIANLICAFGSFAFLFCVSIFNITFILSGKVHVTILTYNKLREFRNKNV